MAGHHFNNMRLDDFLFDMQIIERAWTSSALGRFLITDPLAKYCLTLTKNQFAFNKPISGVWM
jgi:hypothetical protein